MRILIIFLILSSGFYVQAQEPKPYGPLPSKAQLNWQELEMYCLIHFTPTTFQNKEWGFGDAEPDLFNPLHFDAGQIAAAAKSAEFKGLVTVAKHHDGYCLWPTKTTPYNISKSPWKNGKGDLVKEFMLAARKQGLQFGIYVSAWDRNFPGYGTPSYPIAYREQLKEVYSNYGPLFISWHDGANGGDGFYGGAKETRKIDRSTYYGWDSLWQMTRAMQPGAVIFSDIGPDVRWVGNEKGMAGETNWATITPEGQDGLKPAPGLVDSRYLGTGQRDGKYWIPAECDVPLRPGWFYHPDQDDKVKTPDQLFELYLNSVGRGACLNLGLAPDTDGLLNEIDVQTLKAFGDKLRETFVVNLASGAAFDPSNVRMNDLRNFGVNKLTDADRYSYWATDDDVHQADLVIELKTAMRFNLIRLRENIKLGQRLDSVLVEVDDQGSWKPLAKATSIGANRLIRLPAFIETKKLRLRLYAPVSITLSDVGLYAEAKSDFKVSVATNRKAISRSVWPSGIDGSTLWMDAVKSVTIQAFSYRPSKAAIQHQTLATHYVLESSEDDKNWQQVAAGEFSNIVANPIEQYIPLAKPVTARYIRFTVKSTANSKGEASIVGREFSLY
ncbi:alpha-L-fucosidase [bacterium A37T11]|nr:alpha-L-fucosidase [bacterium A37T11]